MKDFTDNYGNETFVSFYIMDMPIYNKQLDALKDELNERFNEYASELESWVWDTCEGVDDDGYGSFRFSWPAEIMNFLTEHQRQAMEDIINNACCETDIVMSMGYLHSYNAGDVDIETAYDVEVYIDTIIDAGYNPSTEDADIVPAHLQDAFDTYLKQVQEAA